METVIRWKKPTIVLFVLLFVTGAVLIAGNGFELIDFQGQWSLCAYSMRRIDPFPLIGQSNAVLSDIGTIPADFGTTPWGLMLGNLFYPGFLPLAAAKVWYFLFSIGFLFVTAWMIGKRYGKGAFFLAFLSLDYLTAVNNGNAGGQMGACLILSMLLAEERPLLSGVLLSFAMVKPQSALLFCVLLLLHKQWKPLLTAAVIDIAAWIFAGLYTGGGVLGLLKEFLHADTGGGKQYAGLFSLFRPGSTGAVMVLSMVVSLLLMTVFDRLVLKEAKLTLPVLCLSAVLSTCWAYAMGNDNYVLILPVLLFFCGGTMRWDLAALFAYSGCLIREGIRKILAVLAPSYAGEKILAYTLYSAVLLVLTVLFLLRKARPDKHLQSAA